MFLEAYEGYSKSHVNRNIGNKTSYSLVLVRYICASMELVFLCSSEG